MVDERAFINFYKSNSRLAGEAEDIEDSIEHMILATGNRVAWRTINRLYHFNLSSLKMETCATSDLVIVMPNGGN